MEFKLSFLCPIQPNAFISNLGIICYENEASKVHFLDSFSNNFLLHWYSGIYTLVLPEEEKYTVYTLILPGTQVSEEEKIHVKK